MLLKIENLTDTFQCPFMCLIFAKLSNKTRFYFRYGKALVVNVEPSAERDVEFTQSG